MSIRTIALLAILASAEPASMHGQVAPDSGTVTTIVYSIGAVPIGGALVRSGAVSERADDAGRARIRLPVGSRQLLITQIGFLPESVTVVIRAGLDTTIRIALQPQIASLSEVIIISSTRSGRRIEDEPVRVEVLGKEEVEEKLLMTPGDITMMLNETSGLRVQTTSPSLGGANVRIQGLRGRYTQILSDGLPLYGGQTGGLGLLQIPPMDLGGVEIIKGVASALYGSSALGGVINLLSRRPEDEPVAELMLNQTTLGGTDVVSFLSSGSGAGKIGFTLLAGGHAQKQRDIDSDDWTDLPAYERLVLRPRLFWNGNSGNTMTFTAGFTGEHRAGGSMPGQNAPDGSPYPERLRTRRFDAGGVGTFSAGSRSSISIRASASLQNHEHLFGTVTERDEHVTWFSEAAYATTRGSSSWVVGAALQGERYTGRDIPEFDFVYITPGLFAQGTVEPTPWLALTASGRFDAHSEYGNFVSPRLSLLLRPVSQWTVRASFGSGYFAPGPFTEETEVTGLAALVPLGELKAERARSASLDVGGSIGGLEVNGTLFGSLIRDPAAVRDAFTAVPRVEIVNATGPTRTSGAELLLRMHPEPFHFTVSYTFVRSTDIDPLSGERRTTPLTPRHQAGIVAAWENEGRARAGLEIYYTGLQSLPDDFYRDESKPYVHIGILAERRFGAFRIFINAENLLNYRQTKYDPLVLPFRGVGGRWTNDVWAPLDGRVANIGVRINR